MDDLISRDAVINKAYTLDLSDLSEWYKFVKDIQMNVVDVEDIKTLPSVQQPTAKWVGEYGELYDDVMIATTNCSHCKESVVTKMVIPKHFEIDFEYKYCPNCGAKMEDER